MIVSTICRPALTGMSQGVSVVRLLPARLKLAAVTSAGGVGHGAPDTRFSISAGKASVSVTSKASVTVDATDGDRVGEGIAGVAGVGGDGLGDGHHRLDHGHVRAPRPPGAAPPAQEKTAELLSSVPL